MKKQLFLFSLLNLLSFSIASPMRMRAATKILAGFGAWEASDKSKPAWVESGSQADLAYNMHKPSSDHRQDPDFSHFGDSNKSNQSEPGPYLGREPNKGVREPELTSSTKLNMLLEKYLIFHWERNKDIRTIIDQNCQLLITQYHPTTPGPINSDIVSDCRRLKKQVRDKESVDILVGEYKRLEQHHRQAQQELARQNTFGFSQNSYTETPVFTPPTPAKTQKLKTKPKTNSTKQTKSTPQISQKEINRLAELANHYAQQLEYNPDLSEQTANRMLARQRAIEQSTKAIHIVIDPLRQALSDELGNIAKEIKASTTNIAASELGFLHTKAHVFMELTKDLEQGGYFVDAFNALDVVHVINDTAKQTGPEIYTKQAGELLKTIWSGYKNIRPEYRLLIGDFVTVITDPNDVRSLVKNSNAATRGFIRATKEFAVELKDLPKNVVEGVAAIATKMYYFSNHYLINDYDLTSQLEVIQELRNEIERFETNKELAVQKLTDLLHHEQQLVETYKQRQKTNEKVGKFIKEKLGDFYEPFEGKSSSEQVKELFKLAYHTLTYEPSEDTVENVTAFATKHALNYGTGNAAGKLFVITGEGLGALAHGATELSADIAAQLSNGNALRINGNTIAIVANDIAEAEAVRAAITTTAGVVADITEIAVPATALLKDGNDLGCSEQQPDWTPHGYKHSSSKNLKWKDVIKQTKNGPAKYHHNIDIEKLERMVWQKGTKINNGKPWKVMKLDYLVGAKNGIETQFVRVEMSANTIHGHPITKSEYLKLLN
ncbi:hypothetical protein HRU45_04975 [Candidatus Dependentiae bacterium]|nr:hypothetical protein [Candidatus Dependentiae bacterium]